MIRAIVIAALCLLAGCQSGPTVYTDQHTGQTLYYGSNVNAYHGALDWLRVRPFISKGGQYGFETTYSNYGWIFIREAWSNGQRLQYRSTDSTPTACGGAGGCITLENGIVLLSETQFRTAAKSGFAFGLRGDAGSVDGKIPASAFNEALKISGKSS